MSHFDNLPRSFTDELVATPVPGFPDAYIERDGNRYYWVYDANGSQIIQWECRPFPGCGTLIITTKVELRDDLRGRGLGRFFRELRHRAYKRAGFVGELATVRSDNAPQNALMHNMHGLSLGEFRSDFGGTYKLWLTNLLTPQAQNVHPGNITHTGIMGDQVQLRVGIQARVHEADLTQHTWVGETLPDASVPTTAPAPEAPVASVPTVRTLLTRPKKFAHRKGSV